MRFTLIAIVIVAAQFAQADRTIFLPNARKYGAKQLYTELNWSNVNRKSIGYVGIGLGQSFEGELQLDRTRTKDWLGSFNFAFNYLEPLKDILPGIAVGIRDVFNQHPDGRSLYVALTFANSTDSYAPVEVTLGAMTGPSSGGFVGIMIPFSEVLTVSAEADRRRITTGFALTPMRGLKARIMLRQNETLWGASYSVRF